MAIKPLNHYSLENPASVYDEEAMSALELAGRTAHKVNETVKAFNELEESVPGLIADKVNEHIKDGQFDEQIDKHNNELVDEMEILKHSTTDRLDALLRQTVPGSTTGDAELADMRLGADGKLYGSAGQALRGQLATLPLALPAIEKGIDLNEYTKSGNYILATSEAHTNGPVMQNLPRFLIVEGYGQIIPDLGDIQTWGKQTVYCEGGVEGYYRFYQWDYIAQGYIFFEWCSVTKNANARVLSDDGVDINTIIEPNNYIIATANSTNGPIVGAGYLLTVEKISGWYVQEVHGLPGNNRHFIRTGNSVENWGAWCELTNRENVNLTFDGVDLNQVVESRTYVVATSQAQNKPDIANGFMLRVTSFGVGWVLQEAFDIYPGTQHFYRTGRNFDNATVNFTDAVKEWSEWVKVASSDEIETIIKNLPTGGSDYIPNSGYTIVNLGDSIFGAEQGATSVSNYIAMATGATVINGAFGGTRAVIRDDMPWNMFDLPAITNAIITNDWSAQEHALENYPDTFPAYFADTVARLKATDFSQVDIVTINHGTNDFSSGTSDTDYFMALMANIIKLNEAFSNVRIVLIGVANRFDNVQNDNCPLIAYSDIVKENAISLGYVCILPYVNLGFTYYNHTNYFEEDGVHLNARGRRAYANYISNTLKGM